MKRRRITVVGLAVASMLGNIVVGIGPAFAAVPVAAGTVKTRGTSLSMRVGVTSTSTRIFGIPSGNRIGISCQVLGQTVSGAVRTTRVWDRLSNGYYVSDAYVVRANLKIPICTTGPWMLPVTAGLISGYRTAARSTHDGVDLGAIRNTPIRAAAAGTVIRVVCNVSTDDCDVDGSSKLRGCGWYAEIQHTGGFVTRYCHMIRRPSVAVGQVVIKGQIIGYVGTSGSSSGPHLHFEVHSGAPATRANALDPIPFMRARGLVIG